MENTLILSEPFYNYKNALTDVKSIIHCINLLPTEQDGLVGAEIGVFTGNSFLTILQNCPNVKTLYGVDSYKPYVDYLKDPYDGTPAYVIDEKKIEYIKLTSYHHQKYSGFKEKIIFYEMDSSEACKKIDDESLDFIFLDTYMFKEQCKNDLNDWYPKVKKGGLFSAHDWNCSVIQEAITEFRESNKILGDFSKYDNTCAWIKK